MKYENQKPDLAEQVKALVQSANSVKTVPHGVKTVEPGEGLQLLSGDGADIFWDWETANTWDTRITEGRAAIEQARADLDKAEEDLAAGAARVEENRAILDALTPQVAAANTAVEQTSKDLDALTGTVGDVGAAAARAQKNAQDALLVGFGRDILPPRGPDDVSAWGTLTWDPAAPGDTAGTTVGALAAVRGGAKTQAAQAAPGEYAWSVSARASAADTRYYLQTWCYAADGTNLPPNVYLVSNRVVPTGSWETLSGAVTFPKGTATVVLQIYALHQNGARPEGAIQWFRDLSLRRLVPGALVVNGSITGEKVDASTVSGALGQFLKVEAASGTFTDSLTGRNARLLGETVAESINITGKLRGRDAILSGTVDVGQLNVTGAMSATIVRALDIQARRGIFTEGLTAQDSTLLGTTVAETINAGTVATRIMTSGLLQTTTDANRGVKVDNNGIRAWDDAGRQTVNLNGKDNYVTGTFATAEKEQRVEIKSGGSVAAADFYGSGNTVDHLGVWHQADQGNATASRIISQNGLRRIRENPGMIMWPFRGDFSFTGRWARNGDALKMFSLANTAGLAGGSWADVTFTFATAFQSIYADITPMLSVESSSGAECTINVTSVSTSKVTMRAVNKSTNATGRLVIRGIVFNFNNVEYTGDTW